MKKILLIITLFSFSYPQSVLEDLINKNLNGNTIGVVNSVIFGNTIGIVDNIIFGNTIGIVDNPVYGKNIYLTDSYNPKLGEEKKVYNLVNSVIYGNTIGIVNNIIFGNTIGVVNNFIYGNTYGFTDNPSSSDIIIVVDLDLIIKIFSGYSVFKTIIKNYNSSEGSKTVEELYIVEIKRDGETIFLSNGSIYEVLYQSYVTSLWLPYSSVILINDNQIINPDWDSEKIDVYKIK